MALAYTLKTFDTNPRGEISNLTELSAVNIKDIRFEQQAGDELWIESGELTLKTYAAITAGDWMALYINNILADVFSFREVEYDVKRAIYTYQLFPIQKIFMDDLAETLVEYSADSESWNYNIPDAEVSLLSISVLDGDGNPQTANDVAGYQPLRMVKAMIDTSERIGYFVSSARFDGSTITDSANDKGTLFRGLSIADSETDQNKINFTFNTDGVTDFDMNWLQVFTLLAHSYNAFVKVTPEIVSGTPDRLGIIIDIMPRIYVTAGTPISVLTFAERNRVYWKYQLQGVKITGLNFEYKQGGWNAVNIIEKSVDVGSYTVAEPDYATMLYYRGYSLGNPPYFESGVVETYYADMLANAHGYEGKCLLNYNDGSEKLLKVLDQVSFDSTTIMINRLSINSRAALATFEGIQI